MPSAQTLGCSDGLALPLGKPGLIAGAPATKVLEPERKTTFPHARYALPFPVGEFFFSRLRAGNITEGVSNASARPQNPCLTGNSKFERFSAILPFAWGKRRARQVVLRYGAQGSQHFALGRMISRFLRCFLERPLWFRWSGGRRENRGRIQWVIPRLHGIPFVPASRSS